jgi:hypothetical protein
MHPKSLCVCIIFAFVSASLKSQPTNLIASRVLLNRVALTWNDNTANETKFVIERKDESSPFAVIAEVPANTTTYSDDLPEYNKVFTYRVYGIVSGSPTSFTNTVQWSTALFKAELTNLPNVFGSLDVADYTDDGKMDLLVMGHRIYNGNTLDATNALFENSPTWSLQPVGSAVLPVTSSLSFEDMNGDHLPDLYQHGFASSAYRTETFINAGNKTFISVENAFTTADYELVGWWDYDLDNDLDAVVFQKFATNPSKRRVLRNDGDGNFFPVDAVDVNCAGDCPNQKFVAGDFDRDGDEDLVKYTPGVGYEMVANDEGVWSTVGLVFESEGEGDLQTVDYDADGWLDLFFL